MQQQRIAGQNELAGIRTALHAIVLLAQVCLLVSVCYAADDGAGAAGRADIVLNDELLLDQHGREIHFRSDVIDDRLVALNVMFTTCQTVCPVTTTIFAQLQERLGERLGRDVTLISISVDPVRDTPQRLADYAAEYGARPGWLWLTGPKANVDRVLKGLGGYTPDFHEHPPFVLVGDGRTGQWWRYYGFVDPGRLADKINALRGARDSVATAGKQ